MTQHRLRQVHPPETGPDDSPTTPEPVTADAGDGADITVTVSSPGRWEGRIQLDDGRSVPFLACRDGQQVHVWIAGETYVFSPPAPAVRSGRARQDTGDDIVCPVPGVVIAVHVAEGDVVEQGQDLVTLESMKTEQVVRSHRPGTVQRVSVKQGDRVDRGMRLVALAPEGEEG